jgi:hypothetical protein
VTYFYTYVFIDCLAYADEYTFNTKFYHKFDNYNESDSNESTNFDQQPYATSDDDKDEDENESDDENAVFIPLPKTYINYQGKVLSKDGDNLSH